MLSFLSTAGLVLFLLYHLAEAGDYSFTIGADNGVTTRYRIVGRACQGSTCRTLTTTGHTGSSTKTLFKSIPGSIVSISFQLLNDNDPAANGKDVNLIIREVLVHSIRIFPSIMIGDGIIKSHCIAINGAGRPSNCPRPYAGDQYILAWNNILYTFDDIYSLTQYFLAQHRHLWGSCSGTVQDVHKIACHSKLASQLYGTENFQYSPGSGGSDLDTADWKFDYSRGDRDWRGTGTSYAKAIRYAQDQTGVASYLFTPLQRAPYDSGYGTIVDMEGPNGESVNMDVPIMNNPGGSGPAAPHIGYTYFVTVNGKKAKRTAHLFVDDVPYTRVKLDLERENAPKPIILSRYECDYEYWRSLHGHGIRSVQTSSETMV